MDFGQLIRTVQYTVSYSKTPIESGLITAYKNGDIKLLEQHAEENNSHAQNFLGLFYKNEEESKALGYFIKSADQGNDDAKRNLKNMLLTGRGVNNENRVDVEKRLWQIAQNPDEFYAMTAAKFQLGILLKETKPGQAILLFDGMDKLVDFPPINENYIHEQSFHHIIDLLCSSHDARKSLGESKCLYYLNCSERSDAKFLYAELNDSVNVDRKKLPNRL